MFLFIGEDDIVSRIQTENTTISRLPCPLKFMMYRQGSDWLRDQIVLNHTERGYIGTQIAYGDDEWHPDF